MGVKPLAHPGFLPKTPAVFAASFASYLEKSAIYRQISAFQRKSLVRGLVCQDHDT